MPQNRSFITPAITGVVLGAKRRVWRPYRQDTGRERRRAGPLNLVELLHDSHDQSLDDRPPRESDEHFHVQPCSGSGREKAAEDRSGSLHGRGQDITVGNDEITQPAAAGHHSEVKQYASHQDQLNDRERQHDDSADRTRKVEAVRVLCSLSVEPLDHPSPPVSLTIAAASTPARGSRFSSPLRAPATASDESERLHVVGMIRPPRIDPTAYRKHNPRISRESTPGTATFSTFLTFNEKFSTSGLGRLLPFRGLSDS